MTEIERELRERVAILEAQLRETRSGIPSPGAGGERYERSPEGGIRLVGHTWSNMPVPPRAETIAIRELVGHDGVPHDIREVRRLVAAVALCRGEDVPGARIPRAWGPVVRQLAAARARGLTWRAALSAVALEPPSESAIAERARNLRSVVGPLWNGLLPVASLLKQRGTSIAARPAFETVKRLIV